MRIVVIGGSGHVGSFLIPRLVNAGHQVISISRGKRQPYQEHRAWNAVEQIAVDRELAERNETFGPQIQTLAPDVVIDMICFSPQSARHLVNALRGKVQHVLVCGTIWVHGRSIVVPTVEAQKREPFGDYGIQKERMTAYLLQEARLNKFPVTVLHPGHIVGPGWVPLNPQGNFNPEVFCTLARGEEFRLPTQGMETLHHVHADDVAQAFVNALTRWNEAIGEDFHIVSEAAVTLYGYAEAVASWFGNNATIRCMAGDLWEEGLSKDDIAASWEHLLHSPSCSLAKARRLLGYQPRYTSLQAIYESVQWLIAHHVIKI
ncbi:epimerase [candidate division KSB3 bacterium]|uniref:Epimerase n=1 Tax=candidate division KSB3 bacterium TaxID=2044937 RepID=A0A2G6E475_9BACT|nr:MAG: epimerase [candidate division KSB3 bacterium]PIE29455.1 MAG: epimerase [candidate division KSB3 bacterium]